jgi:hypothetical protein
MSFRCECCGEPQAPRKRPNRVVVETRKVFEGHGYDKTARTEIAREQNRCDDCRDLGDLMASVKGMREAHLSRFVTIGDHLRNGVFDASRDG